MPTSRSYQDACGIARALDVVGERWALLVVRELLLGPQRFGDLRRALPGISSNLLTDRLRELQGHGVVARRALHPTAGSMAYELTPSGRDLEPAVLALGAWGLRVPLPEAPQLSATSVLLFLRGTCRPDPTRPAATLAVELDDRSWTVTSKDGSVTVETGEPVSAVARLVTRPAVLNDLIQDPTSLPARHADGSARVEGDLAAVRELLTGAR